MWNKFDQIITCSLMETIGQKAYARAAHEQHINKTPIAASAILHRVFMRIV
jgi:hypothetical protein